jgi:hypothetical protein
MATWSLFVAFLAATKGRVDCSYRSYFQCQGPVNSKQRSHGSLSISKWPCLVFCLWKATGADGSRHQPGVVIMTVRVRAHLAPLRVLSQRPFPVPCQREEQEEAKTRIGLWRDEEEDAMILMIRIRFPARDFDFTTSSRPALGPTQPPAQWESWTLSTGVMRPGQEGDSI